MRIDSRARADIAKLRRYPDEELVVFRAFASKVIGLHKICERPACRRAGDCTGREAPCLFVYREAWDEVRPHLYKALQEQVARNEAAEAESELQDTRAEDRKVEPAFRTNPTRKQTRTPKAPRRSPRDRRSGRGYAR